MGRHRILCGDARLPADVERVLGGAKADALITDPPYGVSYVGGTAQHLTITGDQPGDLIELLTLAFFNAREACMPGAPWYVFGPGSGEQFLTFAGLLSKLGVWRQTLVWVKDRMVLGRSDYHSRHENIFFGRAPTDASIEDKLTCTAEYDDGHEAILYGWAPGGAHRQPSHRNWNTVWEFDRRSANPDHPTMKPIELIGQCVDHATAPGRLVLELFAGSGTTIVACEQLGRRCAAVEIDPRYCDVSVQRAATAAGVEARLEGGGTFEETRTERAA